MDLVDPDLDNAEPLQGSAASSSNRTEKSLYEAVKRAVDTTAAVFGVVCLLPLFALIALLIKLDSPGPVLYRQKRIGRHGAPFWMYKFRTMCVDADKMIEKFIGSNEVAWPAFKMSQDPRVTRVGRVLRRSSLDELPQLINVLKGEMSLVGPRPHSYELSFYREWQKERLDVQPGITGPAQIWHRHADFATECVADLRYVRSRSLRGDAHCLLMTLVHSVFRMTGK